MPSLKPRIALAALATTVAVAGLGAGTADARMAATSFDDAPTFEQVRQPDRVMELEVFPTGDGPGDEEVCGGFENRIEEVQHDLKEAFVEGDGDAALQQAEALDNLEDMAMDAGCAIIY